jgi:glycosyltransferase involved in cell wall biosynthesis
LGKFDALVEIWNGVPFMTPLLTRGPNMAFLHHQHGPLWNIALPKPLAGLGRFLERKIYPNFYRSTPIVTLSESSRSELSSVLRLNQENIHVVEPGVSPSFHSSSNKSEDPLVVVAGRLSPYKQIDRVIKAVNNVRTVIPNVKLEIIGEGPDESNLRTIISSLPDSTWILLRGRVAEKDLIETYQRAWVVSSASLSEGWGMTLTEGARCGTASVASNIPGHTDAVSHGVSGYLFDNDEEYEEHLISLLSSRNNAISLGESALQWSSHFTWEKAATESFRVLASTKKNNA